ncbi:unnamed protein product [Parajaminaea phylloscopi]
MNIPLDETSIANLHSISQAMLAADVPSYISARSANSIISEARPTRIQAETLSFLNRILDELLLFIVASAKSLATDRIKTDGLLKVLNNNNLAKDAVLEAELELRKYLQGKKAEGGRVPLGLSATSRWDGTEAFPVNSAYNALRTRCQYYSTLGDREDESAASDQHIMSPEGRPIATITPGVSIYVTALLEFVGEYILQHVAQIIERDNSDEASLADLRAAIEEDESMITLWRQMVVKQELEKRMSSLAAAGGSRRVTKPWQVPASDELDEAAGAERWNRRISNSVNSARPDTATSVNTSVPPAGWTTNDRGGSLSGHDVSASEIHHTPDYAFSDSHANYSTTTSAARTPATSPSAEGPPVGASVRRRNSVDKGFGGFFSGRRRGSFRASQDGAQLSAAQGSNKATPNARDSKASSVAEPMDDFEALMMSGQTMKVSLTPNRLRTIEVARREAAAKKEARQRPGTLNIAALKADSGAADSIRTASPSSTSFDGKTPNRPDSRNSIGGGSASANRKGPRTSNPPSSYRGPDAAQLGHKPSGSVSAPAEEDEDEDALSVPPTQPQRPAPDTSGARKMTPRDKRASWSAAKDMIDLLASTPPSPVMIKNGQFSGPPAVGMRTIDSAASSGHEGSIGRMSGVGGKVRALWGRKSNSGKESPALQVRSDSRQSSTTLSSNNVTNERPGDWVAAATPEARDSMMFQEDVSKEASSQSHGSSSDHNLFGPNERVATAAVTASAASDAASQIETAESMSSQGEAKQPQKAAMTQTPTPRSLGQFPSAETASNESVPRRPTVGLFEERTPSLRVSSGSSVPPTQTSPLMSSSSLRQSRPDGPPSRKIPYGRRASRDEGILPAGRRASLQSPSDGNGEFPLSRTESSFERANGTRSATGFTTYSTPADQSPSNLAQFGSQPTRRGVSMDGSASFGSPPMDGHSNTINILTALERQMKLCTSAEACRALLSDALHLAMRHSTADTNLNSQSSDPTSTAPTTQEAHQFQQRKNVTSPSYAVQGFPSPTDMRQMPSLVMADGYIKGSDESTLAFQQGAFVAAWLLGDADVSIVPGLLNARTAVLEGGDGVQSLEHSSPGNSPHEPQESARLGPGSFNARERKLSQATMDDVHMYASADEGDVEDEDETSTESERHLVSPPTVPTGVTKADTPVLRSQGSFAPVKPKVHPPTSSGAALRLSSSRRDGSSL